MQNGINPMMAAMALGNKNSPNMGNLAQKMMNRFFRKVDNVVWDLSTGAIGVRDAEGNIITLSGEGEDAQISINPIDQFGMAIPAFAQNVPIEAVKVGDLIYGNNGKELGWVISKSETGTKFKLIRPSGTVNGWNPPKVQCFGVDSGVMVLKGLTDMLGGNTAGFQGMLMPLLWMGMDIEGIMPMLLMSQISAPIVDADGKTAANPLFGNNTMISTMMQYQMMQNFMQGNGGNGGLLGSLANNNNTRFQR